MKNISPYIETQLKELPEAVLGGLLKIKNDPKAMKALQYLIEQVRNDEERYVFEIASGDDTLPIRHAYAKGRVSGMGTILDVIQAAAKKLDEKEENG